MWQDKSSKKSYGAKKPLNIWDVNVDYIVISNLIETENNSKYLNGYLDEVIRPLVLILTKMSGYVKTFKFKDGDRDKKNQLMKNIFKKYKIFYYKKDKKI